MPPVAKGMSAPRSFGDWALSGIGFGAATASAGFAAYMVALSPKEVPSGDFRIFAQFDHRYRAGPGGPGAAAPASGPATGDPAPVPAETRTAETDPVDLTPTGSIAAPGKVSQTGGASSRSGSGRYDPESVPLPGFTVRDVFDGRALVQTRSSLSVVKPGSVLDGAGQVLSIERRGDQWVVLTNKGFIAAGRR